MCFLRWRALLLSLVLMLATAAWAEVPVPPLKARVTDLTATLASAQQQALENNLQNIEKRTGVQIAVLLVPTTQPEAIEQYSIRVVDAWKLGKKGEDKGLLLLIAKNDRKLRIEVGYGLEGVIPDVIAKRVIDETITPRFKAGDFSGGITAGVERLARVLDGGAETSSSPEANAEPISKPARNGKGDSDMPLWLLAILAVVGTGLRYFLGPLIGASITAIVLGLGVWFFSGTLFFALIAAVVGFIFVLVGITNWISMGLSGSSSSGGFSGGGGGFGGGGASGNW